MTAPASAALGPYRLVERIAVGGMAEVFRAERPDVAEGTFVVKRLLPHLAADPAFVAMFTDEARLMERLDHPNLVKVHDHGEEHRQHWLGMEHVDGATLSEVLQARAPLAPGVALHVAAEVCAALAYVHTFAVDGAGLGIVHRDVTPGNVFLARDGRVKLGDFGVAKARGRTAVTTRGQIKGTLAYMAPEQARGEEVDARVDLYAVGLLLYEMLTGRRYLGGDNEAEVLRAAMDPPAFTAAALPAGLGDATVALLRRALHPLADGRHRRAADLEREARQAAVGPNATAGPGDVAALLAGLPAPRERSPLPATPAAGAAAATAAQPERPATVVQTPAAPSRRRHAPLVAGLLLTGSAALVAAWLAWGPRPSAPLPGTAAPAPQLALAPSPGPPAPATSPAPAAPPRPALVKAVRATPPTRVPAPVPRAAAVDAGPAATPVDQPKPRPAVDLAVIDEARKRRGLLPGDAPRCDEGRRHAHQLPASDGLAVGLAVTRATTCYRDFPVDRAFIDAKLARLARRIATTGRESDPAIQALSKGVLDLSLGGRFDEANRVLNELHAALR